ncbi:MAG: hypothetical protein OXU23_28135 [Candidatus Poribacteria bacterium]|nr:hypothetical protein [Candidatus Poribacteria bacterium]
MQQHLIKSAMYFQILLYSNFRKMTSQLQEILLLLSTGHLFGLDNPNQVATALAIPKANLYRHLKDFSIYQWKSLLMRIGCALALTEMLDVESKSAATKSRRRITLMWMIQMIRAMVNYCLTATNGGLKNIITQSAVEMC